MTVIDLDAARGGRRSPRGAARVARPDAAPRPGRTIAIGVGNVPADDAALRWAADEVRVGQDAAYVVHAYLPVRLYDCPWEPVVRARDERFHAGRRVALAAVERLGARRSGVRVEGSAVAGLPGDVLLEFTAIVDLLVLGAPEHPDGDLRHRLVSAHCPVVFVPRDYRPVYDVRPVAVAAAADGLAPGTMRFAAQHAARRGLGLQITCPSPSLLEGLPLRAETLAREQEELDLALAALRAEFSGVPVVAQLVRDPAWLDQLRRRSSLVVIDATSTLLDDVSSVTPPRTCPTAVVPAAATRC